MINEFAMLLGMKRQRAVISLAAALALGVSACGGGGNDETTGGGEGTGDGEAGGTDPDDSGGTEGEESPEPEETEEEDPDGPELGGMEDPYQVGDTVELPDWTVAVSRLKVYGTHEVLQSNPLTGEPPEGTVYSIIEADVTNLTDEKLSYRTQVSSAVVDADGTVLGDGIGSAGDMCSLGDDPMDNDVGPGETASLQWCLTVQDEGLEDALFQITRKSAPPVDAYVALASGDLDDTAPPGSEEDPYDMGEAFESHGWEITVNDFDTETNPTQLGEPGMDPPPGQRWLTVDVTLANVEAESDRFLEALDYFAVTADGETLGGSTGRCSLGMYDGDPFAEEIPTGESGDVLLCVEVPEDQVDELTLMFSEDFMTAGTVGTYVTLN